MIKFSVSNLRRLARSSTTIRIVLVVCIFIALFSMFVLNKAPQKYHLVIGDISVKTSMPHRILWTSLQQSLEKNRRRKV
jgi:hypothetical protein